MNRSLVPAETVIAPEGDRMSSRRRGSGSSGCFRDRAFALCSLLLLASAAFFASPSDALPFEVLANERLGLERIASSDLAALYLGRPLEIADTTEIEAVDLPPSHELRQTFSTLVLERTPAQVESYWQRQIFEGLGVPPPQLATPAEVLDFVVATPRGLGYVPLGTTAPSGTRRVRLFHVDAEPRKISGNAPAYPAMARRARAQGTVRLRVWIDERGSVVDTQVLEGGSFGLGEAAAEAVKEWGFEPGRKEGEAVPSILLIPIDFRF